MARACGLFLLCSMTQVTAVADVRSYLHSPASAAETPAGRAVLNRMLELIDDLSSAVPARYCGTPLSQFVLEHRGDLTPAGQEAAMAQVRGLLPRPQLSFFYDAPPFRVHYDKVGGNAVRNATTDTAADGVPTYVHVAADALNLSWELLIDSIGFVPPLVDADSGGGMDLYDCYLALPTGQTFVIALTAPDITSLNGSVTVATSFQIVHPTMANFPQVDDPLDLLRISCAHEFFHAIHFSLDALEKPTWQTSGWWQEGNAVWLEDYVFPNVNDWSNLPPYLEETERSIMSSISLSDLHPYGGGSMWSFYLVERYGSPEILRQIWIACSLVAGDNTIAATEAVLQNLLGMTFDEAWYEFSSWSMRTGSRWDDSSFSQGAQWPEADTNATHVMFKYPGAIHFTDGTDGLEVLLDPQLPVISVSAAQANLQTLAFLPVHLVGISTTSKQFNLLSASSDSVPMSFFYVARNNLPRPPVIDYGIMVDGDTTLISNWAGYDTLFAVASAGVHSFGSPGGIADSTGSPFILAALDTGIVPASGVAFVDPFPNPVKFGQGELAHFKLVLASPMDVILDIFTLSGDRVSSTRIRRAVNSVDVIWDGKNDMGVRVASGLYMCRVTAGTTEQVFRIGVVR